MPDQAPDIDLKPGASGRLVYDKARRTIVTVPHENQPTRAALAAALEDIIAIYEWCSVDPVDRGYSALDSEIHRAKRLLALSNGMRE